MSAVARSQNPIPLRESSWCRRSASSSCGIVCGSSDRADVWGIGFGVTELGAESGSTLARVSHGQSCASADDIYSYLALCEHRAWLHIPLMTMNRPKGTATASPASTAVTEATSTADPLELALDDLEGIFEALRALAESDRKSKLLGHRKRVKAVVHELVAACDAYTVALISSSRGNFTDERLEECRAAALEVMPTAVKHRSQLADLVAQRRILSPLLRDDLQRLINLSLHCRAAVEALRPTVDRRAADGIGNKILVELRQVTLSYLAGTRQLSEELLDSPEKPRAAVAPMLEKIEVHAKALEALATESSGDVADSLGATMSKDVAIAAHLLRVSWNKESGSA